MEISTLRKPFLTLAMALFCMPPSVFANDISASSKASISIIEQVIGEIANFKTFRRSSKSLELIFAKYCKKTNSSKDQDAVFQSYHCENHTGMKMINLISMEPQVGQNYLLELEVEFFYNSYPSVHKVIIAKLGKPNRKIMNFVEWRYRKDSSLNKLGSPVVNISRNKLESSGRLVFALEQGDS